MPRRFALRFLTSSLLLLAVACAGPARRGRPAADMPLPIRDAVGQVLEEFPGFVLQHRQIVMEDEVRLTVVAPDSATAAGAIAKALAAADSVEHLLSVHQRDSEINAINAGAGRAPVAISPWTETVVSATLDWAERTGGAFDPTVGPLLEVWGFGSTIGAAGTIPPPAAIAAARRLVGWTRVRYDPQAHTVFLPDEGMLLVVRAATKGFALDRMEEAMLAAGATSGIIDLGGDLQFFGPGPEQDDAFWPVSLLDPYEPTEVYAKLELPAGAISTSAHYDGFIEIDGEHFSHVMDPRTGWPARGLASISVYATDALVADILSTAVAVLGADAGDRLLDEVTGVEGILVIEARPGSRSQVRPSDGMAGWIHDLDPPYHPLTGEDD
ncbi:MAG: FAD:protein FMN transferase [Gemmatimonadota bacterium]